MACGGTQATAQGLAPLGNNAGGFGLIALGFRFLEGIPYGVGEIAGLALLNQGVNIEELGQVIGLAWLDLT